MDAKPLPGGGYYENYRREIEPLLPDTYTNVLEIGCGAGHFSARLDQAVERWGVEPNDKAATEATSRLDKVLVGTFTERLADLPDGHFDLVVCNDVIEHMVDHDLFLEQLKTKLKPKAWLVGSVPNVRYWQNLVELLIQKDWRYQDSGILDRTHVRFFTERSWRRSLVEHGYEVERLQGLNKSLKAWPLIILTFGYWRDTQYLQFGFRARYER